MVGRGKQNLIATGLAALLIASLDSSASAASIGYSGRLVDAEGAPLVGPVDISLRFFDALMQGVQLGDRVHVEQQPLVDGIFHLILSLSDEQVQAIFGDGTRIVYVEVEAQGRIYPRQSFLTVPQALRIPIDGETLAFTADAGLRVEKVPMSAVNGLAAALENKMNNIAASSSTSGYLSATDWQRFDAKQSAIDTMSTLEAGSVTTTRQEGLSIKPYGVATGNTGELRFESMHAGQYLGFKSPDSIIGTTVWTLPGREGVPGQMLTTDGQGRLSWASPGGTGDMLKVANLSDVANVSAARGNLGLGALATADAVGGTAVIDGSLTNADLATTAAITDDKLATITTAGKIAGEAIISGTISGSASFRGAGGIATDGMIIGRNHIELRASGVGVSELRLKDAQNMNFVALRAPSSLATTTVWTMPERDGDPSQILQTDGNGGLHWVSPTGQGNLTVQANLSDLASSTQARQNLGLSNLATASSIGGSAIDDFSLTNADIASSAAIATTKLAGSLLSVTGHGLGAMAIKDAVAGADIMDASIVNADIASSAAIQSSKISGSVLAISGHGLGALATKDSVSGSEIINGSIMDADISASAAIQSSKLAGPILAIAGHGLGSLATRDNISGNEIGNGTISDADIASNAAIASTKINFPDDAISGDKVDGGVISNFASNGIEDNAASTALILESSGNVGIGGLTPRSRLAVVGNNGHSDDQLALYQVANNKFGIQTLLDNKFPSEYPYGGSNNALVLQPLDGIVGIGTTTPVVTLHVKGNAGSLLLEGSDHNYITYFPDGYANGRKAWVGFGNTDDDNFTIRNETTSGHVILKANGGNIGIGTASPSALLHINGGQVAGTYVAANSATINWNQGNVQSTNVAAGTLTFATGSMLNGANYTLVLNNPTGGIYTLSSADITAWKCMPACSGGQVQVSAGKDTILTILKVGSTGYVSWTQGY